MADQIPASMSTKYGFDQLDGRQVPRLVVSLDYVLTGVYQGGIHIEGGCLTLIGTHQGSLEVQGGASASIFGTQQGSVSIASDAVVTVTGAIQGSAYVAQGGLLVIEAGGKLAGSLKNNGEVIVRGVFGGASSGTGNTSFEKSGYIKKPIERDGISYYEW